MYVWKVEELDKFKVWSTTLNSVKTRCQTLSDVCKFDLHSINCRYSVVAFRIAPGRKVKNIIFLNFIFKYNQQDATLHNLLLPPKRSTCFRKFLRPSSGAQNCIYSMGYFVKTLLLPATVVKEMELVASLSRQWQVAVKVWQSTPCCIQNVTGGTDQTSGECSLGQTIPI